MATIDASDILLVGSVPEKSGTVEGVFRLCGAQVGERVFAIPDGELGPRRMWIGALGDATFSRHPELEASGDDAPFGAYRLKDERNSISLEGFLPYADAALESYEIFKRLQVRGEIAEDVRFQISLPTPHAAVGGYFTDVVREWPILQAAYSNAIVADIGRIVEAIPPDKLAFQWDYCTEVVDTASAFTGGYEQTDVWPWNPKDSGEEKFSLHTSGEYLNSFSQAVPSDALMGYHVCLGTWPQFPVVAVNDIEVPVRMANAVVANTERRVDYVHLPVIADPERSYFAPLAGLDIGDAGVYLGLECKDGRDALLRRARLAREFLPSFGISHYCGYGRDSEDALPSLMTDLRQGAETLEEESR